MLKGLTEKPQPTIVDCGFSVGLRGTGVSFAFQSLVADDGHKRGIRFDHAFAADALLDVVHADAGSDGFEEVPRGLGHDVAATDALRLVVGHEVEEHVLLDGVSVVVDDFQGEGVLEGIGSLLFKSLDVVVVGAEHQVGLLNFRNSSSGQNWVAVNLRESTPKGTRWCR